MVSSASDQPSQLSGDTAGELFAREAKSLYVSSGALLSGDGMYRYLLWREWRGVAPKENWQWFGAKDGAGHELGEPKSCLFVMLNPSTADGEADDPTIRRCVGFAKRFKFDRLEVVNLFAYRATDPQEVLRMTGAGDPIGPRNQDIIERAAADAGLIICAWGAHGSHIGQDETVRGWLEIFGKPLYALGLTKDGKPRHPLYLKSDAELVRLK